VGNILEEMTNQVPCSFLWFDVLLPADMAIFALELRIAIETILFPPFFEVAQAV